MDELLIDNSKSKTKDYQGLNFVIEMAAAEHWRRCRQRNKPDWLFAGGYAIRTSSCQAWTGEKLTI